MTTPDPRRWTTHRPVILAAPDWPDMPDLKAYAASLGADVEVTPLVRSRHLQIVWVPAGFIGSAADVTHARHLDLLTGSIAGAALSMTRLTQKIPAVAVALRPFLAKARMSNQRARASRLHRQYAAKRR